MSDSGDARTDRSDFEPPHVEAPDAVGPNNDAQLPAPTMINESDAEPVDASDAEPELADVAASDIDLDAIERDLTDVQTALERLNEGSYWTDEITGDVLPDDVLASFPLTRTVAGNAVN